MQGDTNQQPEGNRPGGSPAEEAEKGKKYLVFKLGPFSLALEIEVLKKIYDTEGFPFRTAGSRMIDLHYLTGAGSEGAPAFWIEMEIGTGRYLAPVEDVEGIRELSLALPIAYPEVLRRAEASYIRELLFDGLRMIAVLEPAALIEVIEAKDKLKFRSRDARKKSWQRPSGPVPAAPAPVAAVDPGFRGPKSGKLLVFAAGAAEWNLDLDRVVQIINREEIYAVPSGGAGTLGVVYYSDRAVPVIAAERLAEGASEPAPRAMDFSLVILIETGKGLVGLGCDRIVKVRAPEPPEGPGAAENRIKLNEVIERLF